MRNPVVQLLLILLSVQLLHADYQLGGHPRVLINGEMVQTLAQRAQGTGLLADDYAMIKAEADWVVAEGRFRNIPNKYLRPNEMICTALTYLIERELGNQEADKYAEAVKNLWGDGVSTLSTSGSGHFGSYAIAYDWIYDALSAEERKQFGDHLGGWLFHYTQTPEIILRYGDWLYNQTWGPEHLSTPHCRDGITPKLFVALALSGAGTTHEDACRRCLDSFDQRIPRDCIPRFDLMGGVWSESMGHGTYGPTRVVPWAFQAWLSATGQDWFELGSESTFLKEMNKWGMHTTVPFTNRTAYIDDETQGDLIENRWYMTAPILGARYRDPVANYVSARYDRGSWPENVWTIPWVRFISYDPDVPQRTPGASGWSTGYLFRGAGHAYMRSRWDDPDATWAFFGVGPRLAGHSYHDEGNFMISRKGWLVMRAGGRVDNASDYYMRASSIAYNVFTIFDPGEQYDYVSPGDQTVANGGTKAERDGGIIRVANLDNSSNDVGHRGEVSAFGHSAKYTYCAADLTRAYRSNKVREATRQFLYLRGQREYFVIFDRIDATSGDFPKHWFLHVPTEPDVRGGDETELVARHVHSYTGEDYSTWLSDPADDALEVLSSGRARAFLKTVLPANAVLTRRGGEGYDFWGHPSEPSAQYNHTGARTSSAPHIPWRLEIEAPSGQERDYFLHVIEIGNESDAQMSEVTLIEQDSSMVGVRLQPEGADPVEVLFRRLGDEGGMVKFGGGEFEQLPGDVDVSGQAGVQGDIDGDGRFAIADVLKLILRGLRNPQDPSLDIDSDGSYSVGDVVFLLRLLKDQFVL